MVRHLLLWIIAVTCSVSLFAQKLTIKAPSQAEAGNQVRVSYTLNNQDFDRIQLEGDFDGFEVLFGPSISTSSSYSVVNGKTSSSSSTTFTYTLLAKKAGTFTLPAASLTSGGQKVKSSTAKIEVLPASAHHNQGAQGNNGRNGYPGSNQRYPDPSMDEDVRQASTRRRNAKDIYITATASKKHIHEQEAIVLTYKLYTLLNVDQLAGDIPQLDAFHSQEIDLPVQKSLELERVGDINYYSVVWRKYVLFPQRSGKLTIPSIDFEADVVVPVNVYDEFDAYFYGGCLTNREKRIVRAPSIDIQVDPLPENPENYSGAVGKDFSIIGKLMPEKVDANDAVTLTVTVKGTGNLKLMNAPVVQWPKDYESYDPKSTENFRLSDGGNTGTVTYEYVAVPRHAGKDTIPPVEFCYFDTGNKSYRTIKTQQFVLEVNKSENIPSSGVVQQSELKELGNDIRYIKKSNVVMRQHGDDSFGSFVSHILGYLVALVIFGVVLFAFSQRAKFNADVSGTRGRRAGKAASKRLRSASKLMNTGNSGAFYDEVMRALWGYVADKLGLPVTDLNKENVSEILMQRGVDEETTLQFINVLSECEFARFAPGDPASTMDHLYTDASNVIDQLDDKIRKS